MWVEKWLKMLTRLESEPCPLANLVTGSMESRGQSGQPGLSFESVCEMRMTVFMVQGVCSFTHGIASRAVRVFSLDSGFQMAGQSIMRKMSWRGFHRVDANRQHSMWRKK